MTTHRRPPFPQRRSKHSTPAPAVKAGEDLIWGVHPVLETLAASPERILEITVLDSVRPERRAEVERQAAAHGIAVSVVGRDRFPVPDTSTHQGVCARVEPVAPLALSELLTQVTAGSGPPLLLALDGIQDPHNLGAIIRTASAAGVQGILLPKDRSAPLAGATAKAAAGAMAGTRFSVVTNLVAALEELKAAGFWIYGAEGDAERSIYEVQLAERVCLVVGGEGKGIRPLVRATCDEMFHIPMASRLNSLNASVATGVILFEMLRQRLAG